MFVFKNALKNLLRNKGRNIMLAVIIFVIITATVVSLAINNTASAIINDYKDRFASEVVITLDYQSMAQGGGVPESIPVITAEQYIEFGQSEYLAGSEFAATAACTAAGFDPIDKDAEISMPSGPDGGGNGGNMRNMMSGNVKLLGGVYTEFSDGSGKRGLLTSGTYAGGRYAENDNECIISQKLADENGLAIGSVISLEMDMSEDGDGSKVYTYTLTVTGVYYDYTDEYENSRLQHPYLNRRNEVLTDFGTVAAALDSESGYANMNLNISATYYLNDPADLEAFEAELRAKGLPDEYIVTTDTATYDQIVKPVLSLKNISLIFMAVVLVLGGIIITVLASIAIRERKYEIGTLRAIGMKKSKISLGFLTEMLTMTVICLVLGLLVGYFVSQPVSDALLTQQVAIASEPSSGFQGGLPSGGTSFRGGIISSARPGTTPLSEMNISFDAVTIIEICGIAIVLAAIPTVASSLKITKYEPIKILAERN